MADDPLQPPVSPEILLRYALIGALLSWMLFGISTVQLYIYHVSFPRDRKAIVWSVYIIFMLDIFQSIVAASEAWQTMCFGWGRPITLQYPWWPFSGLPLVSGIISLWVQSFYAWRIYQLGKWRVVPIIIIITALAQAGGAFGIAISSIFLNDIEQLHEPSMFARTIVWLGGGAITDLTIMTSMCYLLYSVKQRAKAFERSGLMVNRLIRLTVETGCACALTAVLELSFFLGMPETNIHLILTAAGLSLTVCSVYSNTLMTSLNSRAKLGERGCEYHSGGAGSTNIDFRHVDTNGNTMDTNFASHGPIAVNIMKGDSTTLDLRRPPDDKLPRVNWDVEMNSIDVHSTGKDSTSFVVV
ncbi:hypothetical protein K466DRAFT_582364 [Polyporus arcularius HHB13444]|uniref:DUF6534 domain-containing protein n=1 Tax=Polyporus arcularius HHB13444 TaxID=1314778 RepID=A0A5C3PQ76_9APHY|nr:hypothetical protein K466DRAFT_582364 [Polyporus arcularius HHB13444]